MRVLVTGASGFVGGAVVRRLLVDPNTTVRGVIRRESAVVSGGAERALVADLSPSTDWSRAVAGVDVVVHAAARVHVMRETASDPLTEFRRVNVEGTLRLARQAAAAGVRRLIFLSSIKVNGEQTITGRPYAADDAPAPGDAYGLSKHEAECALRRLSQETGMEVVIIRPVLVYGPGVKGNFKSMMRLLQTGLPLPLGAIANQRSLVALGNLVDLIAVCARHPAAANQTFLVSDGEDLSTPELLRRLAAAMRKTARLIPVPVSLLAAGARLVGKADIAQRLLGSLQVDITKTRTLLNWSPPQAVDASLQQAAAMSGDG